MAMRHLRSGLACRLVPQIFGTWSFGNGHITALWQERRVPVKPDVKDV